MAWCLVFVVAVRQAKAWLSRPTVARGLERLMGVVFIGFGVRLALDR